MHGSMNMKFPVLLAQYCASDKIEKNEMGGVCSTYGEGRSVYRVSVRKPEGKIPLGRHRHRWEDNIKIDLQEVGCGVWTEWSWLRIGTCCECGNEPSGSIKCGKFLD
jgi:hypothetical protein